MKFLKTLRLILPFAFSCFFGASFADDQQIVSRGAYLARMGDCVACHTAPGGQPYAGGAAINSPFGAIYAPNITPDKTSGIGAWSDDEFYKAMHEGIGKQGEYLYPAFPYQWFSKVSRDDVLAIRAYLNTLTPVNAKSNETKLAFPFDVRSGIAAWNTAYFRSGEFKRDPAKSDAINRGAYLVEGLGHCGDCHTPKGLAMQPLEKQAYSGGSIDGWYAPNITADKERGIGGWSDEDLATWLKTGRAPGKAPVAGPMAQVVRESLAYLDDTDIHAIVAFLKDSKPIADYTPLRPASLTGDHAIGANAYLSNCAFCHGQDGKGRPGAVPALDGNDLVRAKGPENVVRVVLGGRAADGPYGPMPAVGVDMSDDEIADVVSYVRNAWSNAAPATADSDLVATLRAKTFGLMSLRADPAATGDVCTFGNDGAAITPLVDPQKNIDAILASMKPTNMSAAIEKLVARAKQIAPKLSQADVINGLTQAYCRSPAVADAKDRTEARRSLAQFSQLTFARFAAHEKN